MTHPAPTTPGPPRSSIRRQLRAALVLLLIVGGVRGSAWGTYRLTIGKPQLDGVRRHDFGMAQLIDGPVVFRHTFVLTNTSRRTIELASIGTTCGCTVAEPSTRTIGPGEVLEIEATLTLKNQGRKTSKIFLEYGGRDLDVLYLEGSARKRQRLSAAPGPRRLDPGVDLQRVILYIDYDGNDEPPAPSVTAPDGIDASFGGWEQVSRVRRADGLPARWRGRVTLRHTGGTLSAVATAEVAVGADQAVRLPLALLAGAANSIDK